MKSIHNFTVERLDGTTYNLGEIGIMVSSFDVSSPEYRHNREEVTGRHGFLDMGTEYEGRTIETSFTLLPVDSDDFDVMRDDVFKIFNSLQPFYITQDGKTQRWKVKVDSDYTINRTAWDEGETSIKLISASPFSESVTPVIQSFSTASFTVLNDSDTEIDPRYSPLKITFNGASTNLKITNTTTGEIWQYFGTSITGQDIILDGIRSTKGGLSIFKDTNRKLITLAQGTNDFTIEGATEPFTIEFDYRNYKL